MSFGVIVRRSTFLLLLVVPLLAATAISGATDRKPDGVTPLQRAQRAARIAELLQAH